MPSHFRTTIPSLIRLFPLPPASEHRPSPRVSPLPKIPPSSRAAHLPTPCRSSQPILPSSGIAWKTSHWPSSARFPDRHAGSAPNSRPQKVNLPSPLQFARHSSRQPPGATRCSLRLFCRTHLRHCANQIQSAPLAALVEIPPAPQAEPSTRHPARRKLVSFRRSIPLPPSSPPQSAPLF